MTFNREENILIIVLRVGNEMEEIPVVSKEKIKEHKACVRYCQCSDRVMRGGSHSLMGVQVCKHIARNIIEFELACLDLMATVTSCSCSEYYATDKCKHIRYLQWKNRTKMKGWKLTGASKTEKGFWRIVCDNGSEKDILEPSTQLKKVR